MDPFLCLDGIHAGVEKPTTSTSAHAQNPDQIIDQLRAQMTRLASQPETSTNHMFLLHRTNCIESIDCNGSKNSWRQQECTYEDHQLDIMWQAYLTQKAFYSQIKPILT